MSPLVKDLKDRVDWICRQIVNLEETSARCLRQVDSFSKDIADLEADRARMIEMLKVLGAGDDDGVTVS